MEEAYKRVALGALFLDRRLPGWTEAVDPVLLDFSCGDHTLLGQVGRNDRRLNFRAQPQEIRARMTYEEMFLMALNISPAEALMLGFPPAGDAGIWEFPGGRAYGDTYAHLHVAWLGMLP